VPIKYHPHLRNKALKNYKPVVNFSKAGVSAKKNSQNRSSRRKNKLIIKNNIRNPSENKVLFESIPAEPMRTINRTPDNMLINRNENMTTDYNEITELIKGRTKIENYLDTGMLSDKQNKPNLDKSKKFVENLKNTKYKKYIQPHSPSRFTNSDVLSQLKAINSSSRSSNRPEEKILGNNCKKMVGSSFDTLEELNKICSSTVDKRHLNSYAENMVKVAKEFSNNRDNKKHLLTMQFLEEEPFNSFSCVSYHEKPKKMKTGKRGITKRETNSTRNNLKKITTKEAVHKKQNTISNNNAFKILTSPRATKQNTKVLSSRMKVINLNKDHKLKRKLKDSKQKDSAHTTEGSTKKASKREYSRKLGSSLCHSYNASIISSAKTPHANNSRAK